MEHRPPSNQISRSLIGRRLLPCRCPATKNSNHHRWARRSSCLLHWRRWTQVPPLDHILIDIVYCNLVTWKNIEIPKQTKEADTVDGQGEHQICHNKNCQRRYAPQRTRPKYVRKSPSCSPKPLHEDGKWVDHSTTWRTSRLSMLQAPRGYRWRTSVFQRKSKTTSWPNNWLCRPKTKNSQKNHQDQE